MASTAQPVRIGPFTGGLNTYSDPSTIGDTECADINNFDIDLDGTLVSRPPVVMVAGTATANGWNILGYFTWTDGVVYIILSLKNAIGTYFYNTSTFAFTLITATISATSMVQYANKVYLVSPFASANPGGSWGPTGGFVAVATMPHGVTSCIYKERMYIGSGNGHTTPSRLFFSLPSNPSGAWAGTDFLDVNNGDGQDIIKIINYNGAIVAFKSNSIYMFAYDSAPTKGAVQILSNTIGLTSTENVEVFEGILYMMYNNMVYMVTNWNWEQINVKAPFKYINTHLGASSTDYSVSVIGNRLVCKYFDLYYVYGLKTKAWSKWTFTAAELFPAKFWKFPLADPASGVTRYFSVCGLSTVSAPHVFQVMRDTYDNVSSESILCSVRSKTYNFNVPYSYKRLFWWGADLLSNSLINAKIIPVSYGQPYTWNQLAAFTWNQLAINTWNDPLNIPLDVSDSADIHNTSGIRMFVKFLKSIRFRQLAFDISSIVDGTTSTGPFRLFSITAFVSNKEMSNKKIN
jgi:hypothetical protein